MISGVGRYPFNSAYGYRARVSNVSLKTGDDGATMWASWFFGSDGIGFGIIKRWTGTIWEICNNIKVHYF